MSHHHSNKKEPPQTVKPQTKIPETAPATEPADGSAHSHAAETLSMHPASQKTQAEAKKPTTSETVEQLSANWSRLKTGSCAARPSWITIASGRPGRWKTIVRYANIGLMRDLLPVLDNIQRAIEAAEKSTDGSGLLDGVKLVAQQLHGVLEQHHCVKIEALHVPFDPHLHHAILQQPSDEYPANTVIMVTQDGYQLHDRVVRPSQVIVSTNSTE